MQLSHAQPNKEAVISGQRPTAAGGADRFTHAWQSLRADSSVQFNLAPPAAVPRPPAWLQAFLNFVGKILEPIGHFLAWLLSFLPDAAYARFLLWTVILLGAAALLWALYNRLRHGAWRLRRSRPAVPIDLNEEEEWRPEEAGARSWLEEADALARENRFAEAIHHLLFRSVDDIASRRAGVVRPALTSRELAASPLIPTRARELFGSITRLVERSLFGGRAVDKEDWLSARDAYSNFALPSAWRA